MQNDYSTSVADCYVDFHIALGGTSVWHHVVVGQKLFWLIEPTQNSLERFENWILSKQQRSNFFAYQVEQCQLIELKEGNTLMIPSGWIHAVYTQSDALVFSGNFLNSFATPTPMQLQVFEIEKQMVSKEDYFSEEVFVQLSWYILDRYMSNLRGKYFITSEYIHANNAVRENSLKQTNVNLTQYEIKGLEALFKYLTNNMQSKPEEMNVKDLVDEAQKMINEHLEDDTELVVEDSDENMSIEDSEITLTTTNVEI